jgi:very-short-patch-repair endonuclease
MNSLLNNAKTLRSYQTDAEQRLWHQLRAHRFMGLKFKRQKPIGHYIVDFICIEHQLIIEVDGGQHVDQMEYDNERTAWLKSQGFTVLRFWNPEVLQEMDSVLEQIRQAVTPPDLARHLSLYRARKPSTPTGSATTDGHR